MEIEAVFLIQDNPIELGHCEVSNRVAEKH